MEKLRISENGRYFLRPDGTPFVWLADTCWTLPGRLKWDDAELYLRTRRAQRFTVLQIVALDPEWNPDMRDPCGHPALLGGDLTRPNEDYFRYLDDILDLAEGCGFYVLLLPVWGQLVTGDDWSGGRFPRTVTEENARTYGQWLGARMRRRNNLLWCLGGDRMPVHKGVDYRPVWRALAEGLALGLTGRALRYDRDRELWRDLLLTYHACHEAETGLCSTFSYWTEADKWISFIMLQSGHGLNVKNYELVAAEYRRERVMPVWDGEPAYEGMPTAWPVVDENSFHTAASVRSRAFFSLLSGAFGFTYGHASVWCMVSEKDKNAVSRLTWYEALHSPGAGQMKLLRDLLERFYLPAWVPCQSALLRQSGGEGPSQGHRQAARDPHGGRMLVYFSGPAAEELDVSALGGPEGLRCAWYDPAAGELGAPFPPETAAGRVLVRSEAPGDRLLLLSRNGADFHIPAGTYGQEIQTAEIKKVFDW